MLTFVSLAATLLITTTTCTAPVAQGPEGNLVLPGVRSNLVYGSGFALDAYAPAGEPRPAAVIIHGSLGSKGTHIDQLFPLLDKAGYAWFSVDYGSADDVRAALDYIRCPGRFNITPQMVLIGEDTGAAIALALARGSHFDGVVTFGAKLQARQPSGIPGATRVLMIQGTGDEEVNAADVQNFCKQIPGCSYLPVTGAIHNFENWHPDQWYWKEALEAWLRGDRRDLWKDIPYSRPGGRDLLMDAYVPAGKGPFPAVIIVHGGGWEAGDKVTYVSPVFAPLAQAGFAWFSIDYRLTPYVHVPEQLEDVRNAVRFVRQHADWFHVDPSRMALLGESASGHLVAQVVSMPCPGCEVQAVVSFYGVYNFERWKKDSDFTRMFQRMFADQDPATLRTYSPMFHADANLPPMLIIQGTADGLYPGTQEYAQRLDQVHARHEVILLEKAPHGMENWEGHSDWMFYKKKMIDWLEKTLSTQ
ncbi:MAG: alpha/beta hydrolase fold domain-containing protein [Terriglobia bacterium]|jgi:alpha-L-fucosidase 2